MSTRGLCRECAEGRVQAAIGELRSKEGPHYEAWLRGVLAAVAAGAGVTVGDMEPPDDSESAAD